MDVMIPKTTVLSWMFSELDIVVQAIFLARCIDSMKILISTAFLKLAQ
jgi:hypothetical protein